MAKKTLYFDSSCGFTMSAVTENGKLTEFNFERITKGIVCGNMYKGRVESVLPGMQAAFINCGLERNCYLSAEDAAPDKHLYESRGGENFAYPELKVGDEILVQILKPPVGTKGARVTALPSIIGKVLIYMPLTPYVGVSRKIADEELRRNLIFSAERLISDGEGVIVRTAAPYAKRDYAEVEFSYLKNLYAGILERFKTARVGELIYMDFDLPVRTLRDTLSYDIEKIIVGTPELEESVKSIVGLYPPASRRPVSLYSGGRDMLDDLGLSPQVYEMTQPKVALENGGYLVIERTEAMTVIDVNTGKFTGDYNLEQTVYHTNILAAREIARQVKLRNIGGIVVVDFIDMQSPAHAKAITEELKKALKNDKAACNVLPMSSLGLVEFTRKKIGSSPLSLMVKPCRACKGAGQVLTDEFIIFGIRSKLMNYAADGARKVRIDLSRELLEKTRQWQEFTEDIKNSCKGMKIYAVTHKSYSFEQIKYRCDRDENFALPDTAEFLI